MFTTKWWKNKQTKENKHFTLCLNSKNSSIKLYMHKTEKERTEKLCCNA